MKIHIVQKGDTLWKIAKKYGVDFEELKKMNTQLSNPDMIMPGMKIKVPTSGGNIKKEAPIGGPGAKINMGAKKEMPKKEQPIIKEQPIQPIKEQPIKEMPISPVKEVPKEQPKTPYMPKMPMPMVPEVDINNYFMMNMANVKAMEKAPQLPPQPKVKEVPKVMPVKEMPVKEMPVKEMPVKEMPIKEMPIKEAPKNVAPINVVPINEAPVQQHMPECYPMYNPCYDPCLPMYNPCYDPCYPGYPQAQPFAYPQVQGAYMPQGYPQVQGAYMPQGYPQVQGAYMPQGYPQVQGAYMPQAQPQEYPQVQGAYMPQAQPQGYPQVQGAYVPQTQLHGYPQVQGAYMPQAQPMPYQGGVETGMPAPSMPFQPSMMPGVDFNMNMFEESSPLMPPMQQGQVPEWYGTSPYYGEALTSDYPPNGDQAGAQPLMGMGESNPYMPPTMQGQMPMMGYQPAPLPAQGYPPSMLQEKDCGCGGAQPPQPFGAYGMPSGFPPAPMQYGQMMPGGFTPGAYPPPAQMRFGQQGFPPPQMFGNGYPNEFDNGNLFQRNDESSEFND